MPQYSKNPPSHMKKDQEDFRVDEQRLRKILVEQDYNTLVSYADELGKHFARGPKNLSTGQIRNVLTELQTLQEYDGARLQLLRPKLAYAAGRHGGKVQDLRKVLEEAISLTNENNFSLLKHFVEAIVAYHTFYGEDLKEGRPQ
jgi:CRISPR-associated protein Csm2